MTKKKWIAIILSLIAILVVMQFSFVLKWKVPTKNTYTKRLGVSLDCARTYYSPDTIKKYIDLIDKNKGNYLQLHLNDNERFGVESTTLHQNIDKAHKNDTVYRNPNTGKAFLSKDELLDIIEYGYKRGIEVIPEIDLPGHDKSIFKLLSYSKQGRKILAKIKNKNVSNEMNYSSKYTLQFSQKLLSEYTEMLPKGYHIVVGADEVTISDNQDQKNMVRYINGIDDFVNSRKLKLVMWNDSFHKKYLKDYHKNILINYWSLSGEVSSNKDRNYNKKMRATLPQLNKYGFKTVNYNNYYLYLITKPSTFTQNSIETWTKELKRWDTSKWNDESDEDTASSKNNIGACLSIWGDYPNRYSGEQTYDKTKYFVETFLKYQNNKNV